MSDRGSDKQMQTPNAVRAYQREWMERTRQRVKQGEPFAICNGDDFEEILNVMDIPVIVINYWHALITTKKMDRYYQNILTERDYPATIFSMGLAATMDNKPEAAPWGGCPNPPSSSAGLGKIRRCASWSCGHGSTAAFSGR